MFVQVRLFKGFTELLWYHVPPAWQQHYLLGSIVKVPLRKKHSYALVEQVSSDAPAVTFTIRDIVAIQLLPKDVHYEAFIKNLASYYQIKPIDLIKRMRSFLSQKSIGEEQISTLNQVNTFNDVQLTQEQAKVVNFLLPRITQPTYTPTLLHGVTGSGKTEVYKKCIQQALVLNKTTILLLPEVSLAVQFTKKLQHQIKQNDIIFGFHSATSNKEKRLLWHLLQEKKAVVIIGVHLPILLPISNLGLIIIDEEHESGFQEKKHPKINSKEAALMRAQLYNIPIILGSATPSISSLYAVQNKKWHFFQLKKRFAGALPQIKVVLFDKQKKRSNFWITKELEHALRDRLAKKEQSILFLNRRGFSFFVQCGDCNFVWYCDSCSVSLTLHHDDNLRCHYCAFATKLPTTCPQCKQSADRFLKKGIGTQQLVAILQKLFPTARVARADLDTTVDKKKWQSTVNAFEEGSIDILVGTQTITKGYHFPKVTLVGVIWADLNVHIPFYNATETTLQQLIQVAGRAGRCSAESLVIMQTAIEHSFFKHINEETYLNFYKDEIIKRKEVGYPPYVRLADITLKHAEEDLLKTESDLIAHALKKIIIDQQLPITLLGPALPPVYKISNIFVRKIYLKCNSASKLAELFQAAMANNSYTSSITFTPNPLS